MSIYDRALGPQRYMRGVSAGLLNLASAPPGAERPPLPQTAVGNVLYEDARVNERRQGQAEQQQIISGLSQLGALAAIGYSKANDPAAAAGNIGSGFQGNGPLMSYQDPAIGQYPIYRPASHGFGGNGPFMGYQG